MNTKTRIENREPRIGGAAIVDIVKSNGTNILTPNEPLKHAKTSTLETIHDSRISIHEPGILPIDIARELFHLHIEPVEHVTFEERLCQLIGYHSGAVISTPTLFVMGHVIQLDNGQYGWAIEMAAGSLSELLRMMPFPLPFVVFRKQVRNDLRLRICRTKDLWRAARHSQRAQGLKK